MRFQLLISLVRSEFTTISLSSSEANKAELPWIFSQEKLTGSNGDLEVERLLLEHVVERMRERCTWLSSINFGEQMLRDEDLLDDMIFFILEIKQKKN